jgi:hypothetical protein
VRLVLKTLNKNGRVLPDGKPFLKKIIGTAVILFQV